MAYRPSDTETLDAFLASAAGESEHVLLFFTGDPDQRNDSGDVAVVLPELLAAFPGRFRAGVIARSAEAALKTPLPSRRLSIAGRAAWASCCRCIAAHSRYGANILIGLARLSGPTLQRLRPQVGPKLPEAPGGLMHDDGYPSFGRTTGTGSLAFLATANAEALIARCPEVARLLPEMSAALESQTATAPGISVRSFLSLGRRALGVERNSR